MDRFWSKVAVGGPDECWEWQAALNKRYGVWFDPEEGRVVGAHRVSAKRAGMDVSGQHVLHRCDNPPCVNPAHLFLGSHADNMRDAAEKGLMWNPVARANAAKTHCAHGHELTPENVYREPARPGERVCRTCNREKARRYRERKAAA